MNDFTIDRASAVFTDTIKVTETTDTNHADNINAAPKRVFENTVANRRDIEELKKNILPIYVGPTPPTSGPALWFCDDPNWEPDKEQAVATAILGDPADAEKADVTSEVNDVVYPVINATVTEEGGTVVATVEQS